MEQNEKNVTLEALWIGVVGSVIASIIVGSAVTFYDHFGSTWTAPLLKGLMAFASMMTVCIGFIILRFLPKKQNATTLDNVQVRILSWLHNFQLSVKNEPLASAYFNYRVTTSGGKTILVARAREQWSDYIEFTAFIEAATEEELAGLSKFTKEEADWTLIDLKLELSRARMGYAGFTSLSCGYSIFKRIPITAELTEDTLINLVWDMEAMLQTLFFRVIQNSHLVRRKKLIETSGDTDKRR